MKKLIVMAALLLSTVAMAQTSGIGTDTQRGTFLWVVTEQNPLVKRLVLNYGETADLGQEIELTNLQELEVDSIEGQTFDPRTETAYIIPLLAEGMPFTLGQTVFLGVQGAYEMDGQRAETSRMSEVVAAFLLRQPLPPKRIGIKK